MRFDYLCGKINSLKRGSYGNAVNLTLGKQQTRSNCVYSGEILENATSLAHDTCDKLLGKNITLVVLAQW